METRQKLFVNGLIFKVIQGVRTTRILPSFLKQQRKTPVIEILKLAAAKISHVLIIPPTVFKIVSFSFSDQLDIY